MIDEKLLKREEKAVFNLRSLYGKYGYLPFKMSKFEEYELYMKNKDFLVSDRVISFNDTNGKLMALKPDVTLSVIKNGDDKKGCKQKVYYNENVYRISPGTHRFKEIMQVGLECIGDTDFYDIYEAVTLAAESLLTVSDSFLLEISHLGILMKLIKTVSSDNGFINKAISFISEKNSHDLTNLCNRYNISKTDTKKLCTLISAYGERNKVISLLEGIADSEELNELKRLSKMIDALPYSSNITFDFSVVNDINYYNGFIFKGFIEGIYDSILAGGQYDNMMKKMGRKSRAIGFAFYLDMLEQLKEDKKGYDVDFLVLYDENTDCRLIANEVNGLIAVGKTVSAQKSVPDKLRYRQIKDLRKGNLI